MFFPTPTHGSRVLSHVGYALLLNILLPNSAFSADGKNKADINISDGNEIETIEVVGRDSTKALVSSGFKVDVLLTEQFKNSNYNLLQILQSSPGINVRQSGGLGAEFNLSLNGLSGNQIRYFIDGIPMEDFGSALTFPANLVEQIQVYKGVVPIVLGSDALGGAINVITPFLDQDLLDLSYTYGSFNTHKASVFALKILDNDTFVRISSNIEHSDNDYRMNNVNSTDELGNITGSMSAKRFNDQYSAAMINVKFGVINKDFADELSIGITGAKNRNNEQHTTTSINNVFGKLNSETDTQLISAIYKKNFDTLAISAYLLTGKNEQLINDTYNRDYNWLGEYTIKADELQGELGTKSLFTVTDDVFRANISAQYQLTSDSSIQLSHSNNYLKKTGNDTVNLNNTVFSLPNWIRKAVTGLAFDTSALQQELKWNVFAKHYGFQGEINAEQSVDFNLQNVKSEVDLSEMGYGTSLSYQVHPNWLVKTSYELAYRMPEAEEILGTGKYVRPNPHLKPEESQNLNFGLLTDFSSQNTAQRFEANVFYRDSSDFIRYLPDRIIYGIYSNLQAVETTGIESSYYLRFYDNYSLQVNATYQDLINKSKEDYEGVEDLNYGKRIPNEPYLFANARLAASFEVANNDQLSLFWTTSLINEFFLNWEGNGDADQKLVIPTQLTHDLDIEYSFADGSYNVSLSARNIFDAEVFDNFKIEKPGRAFYLKFRYLY
ncbi:TonB-dependent receptor [Colwellia sp. 75C3]|uniref:TonB-dependent receptor n=1 Tax=Colwellia sp. 75C3 TaxID=888425 RepID=UPI0012FE9240|nr:TonB-dependent receptor plug domain-containing protein [Colwellia sp. 75C3]